jgi:hypothetical protein
MFQGAFRRWGMGVPPRNSAKHNNSHEKKHKTTRFDSGSSHFGSPEFTFYMSRGPEERKRVRKGFAGWYEIKFSKNGSSKSGSGKQSTSSNNNNNKQPHNQKKKGEDSEDSIDNKQRKKKRAEEYAKEERAQVHKNATTSNKVESYSKQSRKGRQRARMAKKMEKEANKQTQNGNNNSTVHPKRGTRKDT